MRGLGLLARVLFSVPVNTVGWRNVDVDPVPAEVATAYAANLTTLVLTLAD
ncbi:DUF3987 domain-containing protein [Dactylosporangium sp. NPDC005555]|uniref:DUF3987 domain-containing protein n=1 Tax=Dactylosporangium sp. NPDC005555 TaxID=3154889 RepID=UPI0033BCFB29